MIATLALTLALLSTPALDGPERPLLHELFTDHVVLQRDIPLPIWGWTAPGRKVKVELAGKEAETTADGNGKWSVKLGPFAAGGPHTLKIEGHKTAEIKDVLFGDVWICSGQSNMEMGMGKIDQPEAIAAANHPQIRLFMVPNRIAAEPLDRVDASWKVCTPTTVAEGGWGGFSAVGYFFGRDLNRELNVPIGLIDTTWGGTVAEAWTSAEGLAGLSDLQGPVAALRKQAADAKRGAVDYDRLMSEWWRQNDPGTVGALTWSDPDLDTSTWKTMNLPKNFEQGGLPDFDGLVWFRREVRLPESWAGKPLTISLGPIDDRDTTWFNGVEVGHMDKWDDKRVYKIPGTAVKAGRNEIAVRVLDTQGNGGLYGEPSEMRLERNDGQDKPISLAGDWRYKPSTPLSRMSSPPQQFGSNPNLVTVLYNGMIAPMTPFAIKGAIWYQGESNVGRAEQYQRLLPALIRDWRARFGVGEFPFFVVQLANYQATRAEPGQSAWAELREAQWLATRAVPHSAVANAIDIGDADDIHPKNKAEVGRRLALDALKNVYGKDVEDSGPIYRGMERQGSAIRIRFDHIGGGLVARGGVKLQGFAIAGMDRHFVWADAEIDGDSVVVSSPRVEQPTTVRYAWADNPVCNLFNKAGLPALPFRTDGPSR
jgi:sialate O-acetylesterase